MSGQASVNGLQIAPEIPGYRLIQVIGRGTFGEVWLAEESLTGLRRAVKLLNKTAVTGTANPLRELAGIREYQQKSKDHPCLLQIYHVGETSECYFYAMELADDAEGSGNGGQGPVQGIEGSRNRAIEGAVNAGPGRIGDPARHCSENAAYVPQTIAAVIAREAPMPAGRALDITTQVLRGLEHLHAQELIHRDVKPSNVLVIDGQIKLGDLGLVTSSDRDVTQVGTPGYMPNDAKLDHTADLYATGIMLYEMITGLHRSRFPELPVLRPKSRRERRDLRAAIRTANTAAHPDRQGRFQTVGEMLDVVEHRRANSRRFLNRRRRVVLAVVLSVAAGIWFGARQVNIDAPIRIGERTVEVTGEWGRSWTRSDFGAAINPPLSADLNGDGLQEVVVPTLGSGKVYTLMARRAWRSLGNFWPEPLSLTVQRLPGSELQPVTTNVTLLGRALDLDGDPGNELIAFVNYEDSRGGSTNRIMIVTGDGHELGSFWHNGAMDAREVIDLDGDGVYEIMCAGLSFYDDGSGGNRPFCQSFMVLEIDRHGGIDGRWGFGTESDSTARSLRAYGRIRKEIDTGGGEWKLLRHLSAGTGSGEFRCVLNNRVILVFDADLHCSAIEYDSEYRGAKNLVPFEIYERLWPAPTN
jgi:serine/threonine protein kinase